MNCREVRFQLPFYCHGDLPPEETWAIAAHLKTCPACATEEEELRTLLLQMRMRRPLRPPPDRMEAALQAVNWYIRFQRPLAPRRRPGNWGVLLGVGLLGLGLGILLMWTLPAVRSSWRPRAPVAGAEEPAPRATSLPAVFPADERFRETHRKYASELGEPVGPAHSEISSYSRKKAWVQPCGSGYLVAWDDRVCVVYGRFSKEWEKGGGKWQGDWGFPVENQQEVVSGASGEHATMQVFEGRLPIHYGTLTTTVRDQFMRVYQDDDGPAGRLGLPQDHHVDGGNPGLASGASSKRGEWQRFEGGTIASLNNKILVVRGPIHDLWWAAQGPSGKYGYPTGPLMNRKQRFEGGVLEE